MLGNVAKILNIEVCPKALQKIKNNKRQSELHHAEREKNVIGVYKINQDKINKIKDKKIILLDDIYTTGATVNECSKVLKNAGAKEIAVVTIAYAEKIN